MGPGDGRMAPVSSALKVALAVFPSLWQLRVLPVPKDK